MLDGSSRSSVSSAILIEVRPRKGEAFFNPARLSTQIFVLMLISFVWIGSAFCTDNAAALQDVITLHMSLTEIQFNSIFSFYSIPNVVLVIFSGVLIDMFGQRRSTFAFSSIIFMGHAIFCLGVFLNRFWLLLAGRLVFGVGAESLSASLTKYSMRWFDKSLLNFSMGVQIAVMRTAQSISMLTLHRLFDLARARYSHLPPLTILAAVFSTGLLVCLISTTASLFLAWIDYNAEPELILRDPTLSDKSSFTPKVLLSFPLTFWLLALFCFLFYLPFSSYGGISVLYFQFKNHIDATTATSYLSVYCFIGIFLCLFFGFVTGRLGMEAFWMVLATIICLAAHTLFSLTFISPLVLVALRSIGSSLVACSFWPVVRYVVPFKSIGLSNGIVLSVQNFGLTISPLMIAVLLSKGYFLLELFIQFCFSASLVVIFAAIVVDIRTTDGVLCMSTKARTAFLLENQMDPNNDEF